MAVVRFYASDETTQAGADNVQLTYPFEVIVRSEGGKEKVIEDHDISVKVSNHLVKMWENQLEGEFPPLEFMLFEFAKRHVLETLPKGAFHDDQVIELTAGDEEISYYPFELGRLEHPQEAEYPVQIEGYEGSARAQQTVKVNKAKWHQVLDDVRVSLHENHEMPGEEAKRAAEEIGEMIRKKLNIELEAN